MQYIRISPVLIRIAAVSKQRLPMIMTDTDCRNIVDCRIKCDANLGGFIITYFKFYQVYLLLNDVIPSS